MMDGRSVDIVVMSVYDSRLRRRRYDRCSVVCHRAHIREGSMMMMMWSNLRLTVLNYSCYSCSSYSDSCSNRSFLFVLI